MASPAALTRLTVPDADHLRLLCVTSLADLASHAAAWNDLALRAPERLPMHSFAYIDSYLRHQLEPGESWRCLLAYAGSRLVGVLPLVESYHRLLGQAGMQLRTPSNTHMTSVGILTAHGFESQVAGLFLSDLKHTIPQYLGLSFYRLHERTPLLTIPEICFENLRVVRELAGFGTYFQRTSDFATYQASLGGNFRRNLRRWQKRLAELHDVQFVCRSGREVSDDDFRAFLELEASGWKGAKGSAVLSSPRRTDFYWAMMNRLRDAGWLELHLLTTRGKPIAGQFAMRLQRTLVVWKIAYDESYATYGPGNLLFGKTIERACLNGDIDEINCLTDMDWHTHWKLSRRPYYDLFLYPRRPLPFLMGILPRKTRAMIKQMPGVRPLFNVMRALIT